MAAASSLGFIAPAGDGEDGTATPRQVPLDTRDHVPGSTQRVRERGVDAARGGFERAPQQLGRRCVTGAEEPSQPFRPAVVANLTRGHGGVGIGRGTRCGGRDREMQRGDGERLEAIAPAADALAGQCEQCRHVTADAERGSRDAIRFDDHAQFRELGDPGAQDSRGVGRSASEPRAVRHDLRQPYPHRQGPARERAQCLGGPDGEVALASRHPGSRRPIHREGQRVGVRGLHAQTDQIMPVDGHQDAVDIVPAVGTARDHRQREIDLCVCGDDPRGGARHSR